MIVNPGIRRFLGSAIQRLFNSASFYAPLTHTLALERGTGSPTFTRATTATVEDNEGVLRTAIAGEARFEGARRVRNWVSGSSENFTNANWVKDNVVATADTLTTSLTTAEHRAYQNPTNTLATSLQIEAKAGTTEFVGISKGTAVLYATFNLSTGTVIASAGGTATIVALPDGWYRCSITGSINTSFIMLHVGESAATAVPGTSYLGTGKNVQVRKAQLEDITGRADQTTPSEYVSVGVPTDWLGDELVTNGTFDTDTTGWTAGTGNSLAWQTGAAKCTRAVAGDRAFFGQGFSVVVGAKYVISAEVLSDGTSTTARAYLGTTIGTGDIVTGPAAAFGQVVFEYTAGATGTIYIWFYGTSTAAGNYIVIDNISVKPAYYHGSFVDGVACFDYYYLD